MSTTAIAATTAGEDRPVRRRAAFRKLRVSGVEKLCADAVAVSFAVPEELADEFDFRYLVGVLSVMADKDVDGILDAARREADKAFERAASYRFARHESPDTWGAARRHAPPFKVAGD